MREGTQGKVPAWKCWGRRLWVLVGFVQGWGCRETTGLVQDLLGLALVLGEHPCLSFAFARGERL